MLSLLISGERETRFRVISNYFRACYIEHMRSA